jgi:ATP-binding cassette subfamily B protein
VIILLFGKAVGKRFTRVQAAYSSISEVAQESFSGIRVIKTFVVEPHFLKKFADANNDYRAANMELVKVFGFFFPLVTFLSGVTSVILLRFGGERVLDGAMSPGDFVAMFSYLQMLVWPMVGAGFTVNMLQRGAKSLTRVNEIMHTRSEIESPVAPKNRRKAKSPAIDICNLTFAYNGVEPVLKDLSFSIPAGSIVGLFGKTGSGKTTFLKILPRLLDPPGGTVFIDGVDIRDWDLYDLRSLFGVTPQDTFLFSDSVRANIAYGLDEADENRLQDVAGISTITRDLADFKDGWETVIGERGLTLSGGQKQRVSISRAMAVEPEILLLDDAFSAVDTETEAKILEPLLERRRGRTTILVSHRVSTLRRAERIIVFDRGVVSESGTHAELIAAGGSYSMTAKLQQLEDDIDA